MAEINSKDLFSRTPTYHNDADAAYLLPNDPIEQSRLIDQHNGIVALVKHVIHAPVSSPNTVLDIGCGTGIVTRYLSSHFPTAQQVYGIDLSAVPSQPSDTNLSNLSFICGNFRKIGGTDPRLSLNSVDFVYSRLLLCGMTDWPGYFRVKSGSGYALYERGGALQGLDLDAGLTVRKYMEDAGFVDIQRWEFRIPYWRVPGADSEAMTEHLIGDKWGLYWHMIPKLVAPMNFSQEKIDGFRRDMKRDLQEEEGKEQLFCVTIGRKPVL
ncbi:hypothetical protein G7Y89_g5628 [Cudoniella acicularis]|uniref:Methyltransferase domain-containing protein n=1 Tax=Cudoniella acicularis TaxID=354080 RepID=A0A8H4W381_9HELO|nr:hypothetical protein G7Y89_g5628 [Cudoniella acicularis]